MEFASCSRKISRIISAFHSPFSASMSTLTVTSIGNSLYGETIQKVDCVLFHLSFHMLILRPFSTCHLISSLIKDWVAQILLLAKDR